MPGLMMAFCCSGVRVHSSFWTLLSNWLMSMKMLISSLVSANCFTRLITMPEGFRALDKFSTSLRTCCRCQRLSLLSTSPHHHSNPSWLTMPSTSSGVSLMLVSAPPPRPPRDAGVLLRSRLPTVPFQPTGAGALLEGSVGAVGDRMDPVLLRSTSEIRRMATPDGFDAFWIFMPDSITISAWSGVSVLMRSTTPSPRPLICTKIPKRWSSGTACLMRLTTMPLTFRAWQVFIGGSITATRCSGVSRSRASPTHASSWCMLQKSTVLMEASEASTSPSPYDSPLSWTDAAAPPPFLLPVGGWEPPPPNCAATWARAAAASARLFPGLSVGLGMSGPDAC
mmetsp:Transcript_19390/g.60841  ORF Transcript_19390/g.60841 Transcript_19390/m.60841 type:complete len:339 (-) Transcript_19390:119-1135(-)